MTRKKKIRVQPVSPKMRVLVMDGHSRAAVETVQSLGRAGAEITVSAADRDALAYASRHTRHRVRQPAGPAEIEAWLRTLFAATRFTLIVPATEASLLALRRMAPDDPIRLAAVLAPNASLDAMLDKEQTHAHALRVGVPVPANRLLSHGDTAALDVPYPRVLKPVRSKVCIDGRWRTVAPEVVTSDTQRAEVLDEWLPHMDVQEQEYVTGRGEGVNVLFEHGVLRWAFTYQRVHEVPLTGGGSAYRKSLRPAPDLIDAARKLLEPLRWHGVAMVEFKRRPDGSFALIEVNPRLWGSLALPIDCGVDFPRALAALATGMPLLPQPTYRVGVHTRSLLDDVSWIKENLRADHSDPLLMTRSRIRSLLEPLRVFVGRESWDHFTPDDVGIGRRILVDIVREHGLGLRRRVERMVWKIAMERRHESKFRDPRRLPRPIKQILFLCYGNICRSPFAEWVGRRTLPYHTIRSSGFHTKTNRESPAQIQMVAKEMGYDLTDHRSSRVSQQDIDAADLILLMDHDNWARFVAEFPDARARTTCLGLYAAPPRAEIEDPYAEGEAHTRHALGQISSGIETLARALAGESASGAGTPDAGAGTSASGAGTPT